MAMMRPLYDAKRAMRGWSVALRENMMATLYVRQRRQSENSGRLANMSL